MASSSELVLDVWSRPASQPGRRLAEGCYGPASHTLQSSTGRRAPATHRFHARFVAKGTHAGFYKSVEKAKRAMPKSPWPPCWFWRHTQRVSERASEPVCVRVERCAASLWCEGVGSENATVSPKCTPSNQSAARRFFFFSPSHWNCGNRRVSGGLLGRFIPSH